MNSHSTYESFTVGIFFGGGYQDKYQLIFLSTHSSNKLLKTNLAVVLFFPIWLPTYSSEMGLGTPVNLTPHFSIETMENK